MALPTITPIIYPSSVEFWNSGLPSYYGYAFNRRTLTDLPPDVRAR